MRAIALLSFGQVGAASPRLKLPQLAAEPPSVSLPEWLRTTRLVDGRVRYTANAETTALLTPHPLYGAPTMPTPSLKPFLISKDEDGRVRLTVRSTRFNMQNYPIVTSTLVNETFATATAARVHAREHFGAEAGQFASK